MFYLAQNLSIMKSLSVCDSMIRLTSSVTQMHSSRTEQAAFVILKAPTVPLVVIYTSLITKPEQVKLLVTQKFRMKIAEAISGGVLKYFQSLA